MVPLPRISPRLTTVVSTAPRLTTVVSTSPRLTIVVAAIAIALPAVAVAQETLQLNVPYRCQDGTIKVITKCEKTPRAEVCWWREEQNGQVIGERYNVRPQMDGWLKECRPQAAPAPRPVVAPPAAPAPRPAGQPLDPARARPTAEQPAAESREAARPLDPSTIAARRCLELGGGELECAGKGWSVGMAELTGINLGALTDSPVRGLRFGGTYTTDAGLFIAFDEDAASMGMCGQLVEDKRSYQVTRRGNALQVEIHNEPMPLVVALAPDGRITGPAAANIKGNIITGYRTYWVEERRVSDNQVVVGSGHEVREPIYAPKIERCGFASLRASAPVKAPVGVIGALVGAVGGDADPASRKSDTAQAPAGPRMRGKYAGAGGLQVEFSPTAVVLDCGEAHVLRPYAVENQAAGVLITVRNGDVPLTLMLQPDGTLNGSGTVNVAGRVVSGKNATGITFAPVNARCPVGPLAAR